jgi:hypothetical protein
MDNQKIYLIPSEASGTVVQLGSGLFRIEQLDTMIRRYLEQDDCKGFNEFLQKQGYSSIQNRNIFSSSVKAEVMQTDVSGWQHGTIAIKTCFEFLPSKPPEPKLPENSEAGNSASLLDAIRRTEISN